VERQGKVTDIAKVLAVSYLLGLQKKTEIPKDVDAMIASAEGRVDWEAFMPLAMSIFEETFIK
jgi:hypothetical protein